MSWKKLCSYFIFKVSIDDLFDNLESGKINYCFGIWLEKVLNFRSKICTNPERKGNSSPCGHVLVVRWCQRNVVKSVMHFQSLLIKSYLFSTLFLQSSSRLLKLPVILLVLDNYFYCLQRSRIKKRRRALNWPISGKLKNQ